jgi:hypothetical protein
MKYISILIAIVPTLSCAQVAADGNTDLAQCASIQDEGARLACYDALSRGALSRPAGSQTGISPGLVQGNKRIGEEIARLRNVRVQEQASSPGSNNFGTGNREVVGRVAKLESGPRGWIVTLQEGQVWRQMIAKRFPLREGQEVRIKPTRWGDAYRLTAEDLSGYIQVERVR